MDFNLSDEQQMLRDSAARYVQDSYGFEYRRANLKTPAGCSEQQWQAFAELGWLAVAVPESCGGLGCSILETVTLAEELGRGLVLEPYLTNGVLAPALIEHSSAAADLLPALADGSLRVALAHGEAHSRYNLNDVSVTRVARQGEGYRLDGVKTLVLDAPSAHRLLVSAREEGSDGFALFQVAVNATGVEMKPYQLVDGSWAADVVFSAVELPASARLLEADTALAALELAFDRTLLAQVAASLGAMERVLDITSEYLKTRVQFGQPIGKFQALQHRMAEMFVEVQETRSALYRGLAFADSEPAQRSAAASVAKAVAARSAKVVAALGIQLHGGIGMTEEYPVGHYFRYLTAFEKIHGDIDFHLKRMALRAS